MLDDIIFMYEAVLQSINTRLKPFYQEGTSKTVGENIALFMLQFLSCSVRLLNMNKITIEAATYLLKDIIN